ncbi:hypothetical protein ACIPJS_16860 [Streptomyces sp. NPDC086783]|uniref:hypothetical protein n=1 Tax=Streptomyces sp. NPDC086783 TaxID=3365758 RepID=UPI00381A6EDA
MRDAQDLPASPSAATGALPGPAAPLPGLLDRPSFTVATQVSHRIAWAASRTW